MAVESTVEGARIPVPHIARAANRKHPAAITREILAATKGSVPYAAGRRLLPAWLILPAFVRRFIWSRLLADPHRRRRLTGTTFVTAVGMSDADRRGVFRKLASHSGRTDHGRGVAAPASDERRRWDGAN